MLKQSCMLAIGIAMFFAFMCALDQQDKQKQYFIDLVKEQSDYAVFMFDCQMAEKKRADFLEGKVVRAWNDMAILKTGKPLSEKAVIFSLNEMYGRM